jgi:hypothetical protein
MVVWTHNWRLPRDFQNLVESSFNRYYCRFTQLKIKAINDRWAIYFSFVGWEQYGWLVNCHYFDIYGPAVHTNVGNVL